MRVDLPDPRSVLRAMLARFARSAGAPEGPEPGTDRTILVEDSRLYRREWQRNAVRIPAEVLIILDGETKPFTTGTGEVRDISLKGARLTRLRLKKAALPLAPFHLHLRFSGKRYEGIEARCIPRRFVIGDDPELGVQFVDLWVNTGATAGGPTRKRGK